MDAAADGIAQRLEQAEQLLVQKQFKNALQIAEEALASCPASMQALIIAAEASTSLNNAGQAEVYYRRALAQSATSNSVVVGLSRLLQKSGRFDEACHLLSQYLAAHPSQVDALVLLCEVLTSQGRPAEAAPLLDAASAIAPANPRLQLLRGEWLFRCGRDKDGESHYRAMLAHRPASPQVWLMLMRGFEAVGRYEDALGVVAEAVTACPDVFWLWSRQLQMLAAVGRQAELLQVLESHTAQFLESRETLLNWTRLMMRLDEEQRVNDAVDETDSPVRVMLQSSAEGLQLLAELARDRGEPAEAARWLELALESRPGDAALLRELFGMALLCGEVARAKALASRLHELNPRTHGGLEMYLLHELRIFGKAMERVRVAMAREPAQRLLELSRIVLDEPGSLPVAMAWLNQFARSRRKASFCGEAGVIPPVLHHVEDANPAWQRHHRDYQWRDLRDPACFATARGQLPQQVTQVFGRHPDATRIDMLRLAALRAEGGWWVSPSTSCATAVGQLASPATSLVICMNEKGFLVPSLIGCSAGHEAVRNAFNIALTAFDEAPRANSSQLTSGQPALTLGVAQAISRRLLAGEQVDDVALFSLRGRDRWLGMAWPG